MAKRTGIAGEPPDPFEPGPLHPRRRPTDESDGELGGLPEEQHGRRAARTVPTSAGAAGRRSGGASASRRRRRGSGRRSPRRARRLVDQSLDRRLRRRRRTSVGRCSARPDGRRRGGRRPRLLGDDHRHRHACCGEPRPQRGEQVGAGRAGRRAGGRAAGWPTRSASRRGARDRHGWRRRPRAGCVGSERGGRRSA